MMIAWFYYGDFARRSIAHLASDAVAHPLVSALGVGVVGPGLVRGVGPGDLVRARAVRAVAGLVKLFSALCHVP